MSLSPGPGPSVCAGGPERPAAPRDVGGGLWIRAGGLHCQSDPVLQHQSRSDPPLWLGDQCLLSHQRCSAGAFRRGLYASCLPRRQLGRQRLAAGVALHRKCRRHLEHLAELPCIRRHRPLLVRAPHGQRSGGNAEANPCGWHDRPQAQWSLLVVTGAWLVNQTIGFSAFYAIVACVASLSTHGRENIPLPEIRNWRMYRPSRLILEGRSWRSSLSRAGLAVDAAASCTRCQGQGGLLSVSPRLRADERRCQVRRVSISVATCTTPSNPVAPTSRAYGKTVWSWPSLLRSSACGCGSRVNRRGCR